MTVFSIYNQYNIVLFTIENISYIYIYILIGSSQCSSRCCCNISSVILMVIYIIILTIELIYLMALTDKQVN